MNEELIVTEMAENTVVEQTAANETNCNVVLGPVKQLLVGVAGAFIYDKVVKPVAKGIVGLAKKVFKRNKKSETSQQTTDEFPIPNVGENSCFDD